MTQSPVLSHNGLKRFVLFYFLRLLGCRLYQAVRGFCIVSAVATSFSDAAGHDAA